VLLGERAEEQVDRRPPAAGLIEFHRRDLVVGDLQPAIGRNDVDVIGLQTLGRADLRDRHARACREDAGKLAADMRIEMHHHDEGGAALVGQRLEQGLQRLHAAGRCADSDHDQVESKLICSGISLA
jgi:hypothetical protein